MEKLDYKISLVIVDSDIDLEPTNEVSSDAQDISLVIVDSDINLESTPEIDPNAPKIDLMFSTIFKGDPGEGIPPGGTTGQILTKQSDDDYDTAWEDPPEQGTGNYEELDNLPSINGVTLMGDLEPDDLNIEALTNEEIDQLLV